MVFITKAVESMSDPLHEGEFAVFNWSFQMYGERDDEGFEDPSYYISKLIVDLHPSFAKPRRGVCDFKILLS